MPLALMTVADARRNTYTDPNDVMLCTNPKAYDWGRKPSYQLSAQIGIKVTRI